MNIVNITLGVDTQPCSSITLGRRGENEVTQVVVDFSSWVEEFGAGVITLLAMRSQDTSAYPVVLTLDGNTATWDVTSTDTAYKGSGRAEYIYTVGEQIAKSVVFNTVVMQDIGEPSETPPDPYEDWLERLTELGAETQANAEAAEQSAEDAEQSAQEAAQEAANAEGYAEQAGEYASAAQSAEAASESARDEAQTAQASAESSATAASGSATSAAGSASDASASASAAGASATAASASATTASNAATAAQAAQSAAEDAAEDAQQAAQQAHVEYEQLSGEVDDLSDEVAQQKSAIDDLTALTNRKAGMLVDTASGSIASFIPDSTIDNLLGVSVDIEPAQDLHGYDAPWPAGGGVNKLEPYAIPDNTSLGVAYTNNADGSITISGVVSTKSWNYIAAKFPLSKYGLSPGASISVLISGADTQFAARFFDGATLLSGNIVAKNVSQSFDTAIASGVVPADATSIELLVYCKAYTVPDVGDTFDKTVYPMLAVGSTAPTAWTPYENICPISGWDSVEVDRTGKNVFGGEIINGYCPINDYLKNGVEYYVLGDIIAQTSTYLQIHRCDKGVTPVFGQTTNIGSVISGTAIVARNFTADLDSYDYYLYAIASYTNIKNVQITLSTPTQDTYHPYAGNRYAIQLGQTVYGGTLDVTNGTLTVEYVKMTIPSFTGAWGATRNGYAVYRTMYNTTNDLNRFAAPYMKSNRFKFENTGRQDASLFSYGGENGATPTQTFILPASITSLAEANAWLANNPTEATFKLATPTTIQLDPVAISTIAGQTNNVWADAGDVSVEFAADLKTYIDQKIAAAVAALS